MSVSDHFSITVYDGFFKVNKHQLNVDGRNLTLLDFERGESVAIAVYNKTREKFIVVRQFRLAPWLKEKKESFIELIAGKVDPGESPEEAAKRECLEETGYAPQHVEKIVSFYPSVGGTSEIIHTFLTIVSDEDRVSEGGGKLGENEFIEVVELSKDDLYDLVYSGEVLDSKILIACLYGNK